MSSTLEHDPRVIAERAGLRGLGSEYGRRIRQGDIGQLPVVVGLVVIGTIFQVASHGVFLNPFNLVNLTLQMAAGGTIAVGIVLVLLLGEIDLSAGVVSGLCAAIMAVATVQIGVPAPAAIGLGLVASMAIGALHGVWITRFGIPSFIVTLAGLSAWQGALLWVLGRTGTVNLRDPFITALAGTFFRGPAAYACAAVFLAYVAIGPLVTHRRRRAAGLTVPPLAFVAVRAVVVSAFVLGAVVVLDADRGISSGLLFLVGAVLVMDVVLRRLRFGRMIYAIGGNAEAARRAGINVHRIRILVFMISGAMAGVGGIILAANVNSVDLNVGSGTLLLNAIAAAVIGGVSLFGGRGEVRGALLGALVIATVSNGLNTAGYSNGTIYVVTGVILLLAVTLDTIARRLQVRSGR
jgi:D-xylose transport system permease protein